jgi:hypothetical protein
MGLNQPFRQVFEESGSRGLWSLWDMLDQYALRFARAFTMLETAKLLCLPFQIPDGEREPTNREIAEAVARGLDLMRDACLACGMATAIPEMDRIMILVGSQTFAPRLGISQAINHLLSRVKDDLALQKFYRVVSEDAHLYGCENLFGDAVTAKFKDAAEDIKNAGSCLALGQGTACVFHLMRAMEAAVRKLGSRLKITVTPNSTWRNMTSQMDAKINKMPDKTAIQKRKKNELEAARTNLHHVGSVWRNNTMHPATFYTASQARDVMHAVRIFMGDLAEL